MKSVMTTMDDLIEAKKLARKLIDQRLCACANIVPGIQSIYWWNDHVEEASEWLILLKTMDERVGALLDAIREAHPYETPEGVAIDVTDALDEYASWVWRETRQP